MRTDLRKTQEHEKTLRDIRSESAIDNIRKTLQILYSQNTYNPGFEQAI